MCSAFYSCRILMKFEFSRQILEKKNHLISNFMEIRPVGAELFFVVEAQTDGLTDMTKLTYAFRNFCEDA